MKKLVTLTMLIGAVLLTSGTPAMAGGFGYGHGGHGGYFPGHGPTATGTDMDSSRRSMFVSPRTHVLVAGLRVLVATVVSRPAKHWESVLSIPEPDVVCAGSFTVKK